MLICNGLVWQERTMLGVAVETACVLDDLQRDPSKSHSGTDVIEPGCLTFETSTLAPSRVI